MLHGNDQRNRIKLLWCGNIFLLTEGLSEGGAAGCEKIVDVTDVGDRE